MSDRAATDHRDDAADAPDARDGGNATGDELVERLRARIAELEAELRDLRLDLWQSRDATIGATATAGSYKARNVELEMIIGQLRGEVVRLKAAVGQKRETTFGRRLGRAARNPRAVVKRLLR